MITKLINFFKDEEGASLVEYGLLVALIAILALTAITAVGTNVKGVFDNVAKNLK